MRVKPTAGRLVRQPIPPYELLPAEGREVPDNQFWRRRLRDGDVVVVTEGRPPATPPPQRRPE
jgi:hypothetical protein